MLNPAGVYDRVLQRLSRRELMKIAWMLGAGAVARPLEAARQSAVVPYFNAYPFTLGVASGDPVPDGVVLWTRLAPHPLAGGGMPMVPVTVQWEVAREAAFRNIVQKGETVARQELGHSVHVEVSGLEPAHDYWYRFRAGNEISQVGRTRTAPAAGAEVDRLRFGVCGCSHYETGYFTAYRRIAQEQFDFVIHTGDYIYESRADGGRNDARVRQHQGDEIYTLVDYRNRYGLYKSDQDLIAAHRSAPFIVSWDDHEVENNYAGGNDENGTDAAIFLLRRAAVPTARIAVDKWDGYSASRDRLLTRLRDAKTPNPVVLSGDVHQHYASDLQIDFADPRSPIVGVEFTNSSITSGGDGTDVSADWEQVRGQNPHIKYHSNRRGYVACTATPSLMRADFQVVDAVRVPGAPLRTSGTMIAEAGKGGLTPA